MPRNFSERLLRASRGFVSVTQGSALRLHRVLLPSVRFADSSPVWFSGPEIRVRLFVKPVRYTYVLRRTGQADTTIARSSAAGSGPLAPVRP